MKSIFTKLLFGILVILGIASATAQSLQYKTGTHEDMRKESQKSRQPFIIIFESKDCMECEEFENTTMKSDILTDFLNANFTVYKVDAFSAEGIGTTQLFDVIDFPTVMIFNTEGTRLSTVSGIYNPNEFYKQAKYALQNMPSPSRHLNVEPLVYVSPPKNEIVVAERGTRSQKTAETITSIEELSELQHLKDAAMQLTEEEIDADQFETTMMEESEMADVPGHNKYSIKNKRPRGFSIKVAQYNTIEALNAEVTVYEKRWKNQLWVYSQERNGVKTYCIALGLYEDKESAQYIRRLLYESFTLQGAVIVLDDIRY